MASSCTSALDNGQWPIYHIIICLQMHLVADSRWLPEALVQCNVETHGLHDGALLAEVVAEVVGLPSCVSILWKYRPMFCRLCAFLSCLSYHHQIL